MIRFKIVGAGYLDLPAEFDFSFQYNNGVFAFENMQLSRSGEFTIPETAANNALLGFANDPAKGGEIIRKKLPTELHYSGGYITGILSIGKYDSSSGFSAIFVYGELADLKRVSELGNIGNYTQTALTLEATSASITNSYFASGLFPDPFNFYQYKNGIADAEKLDAVVNLSPTVKLSHLMDIAAASAGLTIDTTTIGTAKDGIGVILAGNKAAATLEAVTVSGVPNSTLSFSGGSTYFDLQERTFRYKPLFIWWNKTVKVLVAKQDLTIRFENTYIGTNTTYAVVTGDGRQFLSTGGQEGFFRYITEGSEIQLKTGEYFSIVNSNNYFFNEPINDYDGSVSISLKVYAGDLGTVDYGDDYPLKENLPEITLIDILKTYANLFRCGIEYDHSTNTVSFFNFGFDKSAATELDDIVIHLKSVDRRFIDYAIENIINCKSEDYVNESEGNKFEVVYKIDNDNLQAEKILYTIPFSEGILGANNDVIVNDFELVDPYKKTAKLGTLALTSKTSGQIYMKHIKQLYNHFSISNTLGEIINNSTTVQMSVKMDVKTFLTIKNTDTYKYRGVYYCCYSGTHTNGVADLVLIKI